jgi:hypothetical protein
MGGGLPMQAIRREAVEAALASAATRGILALCVRQAQSVKSLSAQTGAPLASTYRQVKALLDDGILFVERSALTEDGKMYDLYRSRLRSCRIELRAGQVDVSWEMNAAAEERMLDLWNHLRN